MHYMHRIELFTHQKAAAQCYDLIEEPDHSFIDLLANNRWLIKEATNDQTTPYPTRRREV